MFPFSEVSKPTIGSIDFRGTPCTFKDAQDRTRLGYPASSC